MSVTSVMSKKELNKMVTRVRKIDYVIKSLINLFFDCLLIIKYNKNNSEIQKKLLQTFFIKDNPFYTYLYKRYDNIFYSFCNNIEIANNHQKFLIQIKDKELDFNYIPNPDRTPLPIFFEWFLNNDFDFNDKDVLLHFYRFFNSISNNIFVWEKLYDAANEIIKEVVLI